MAQPPREIGTLEDARRYIASRKVRAILEVSVSLRRWRIAGRSMLGVVLAYAAAQYYLLHVFVEILSLPSLVTFAAPLGAG